MHLRYEDIQGHDRVIDSLRAAVRRQRVAHAYLFAGPEGVGKETLARTFVAGLLCHQPNEGGPCGGCGACDKIARGSHPDVLCLEPDGKFIKIEAVRKMTKMVPYKPIEGRCRAVLIPHADRLHEAAANALLKTLEEPSQHTIFVLTTASPQSLLDTIISRCQMIRFNRLSSEAIESILKGLEGVEEEFVQSAIGMANGSVGRALMLANSEMVERRTSLYERLARLSEMTEFEMLSFGEDFAREKKELATQFGLLRSWYRDVLVAQTGAQSDMLTNRDWTDALKAHGKGLEARKILECLRLIDEVESSLRVNVNARLAGERLFLGLFQSVCEGRN